MILCQCAGVEEETISRLIRQGVRTVAEVGQRCGAGQNCPPCQLEIAKMLKLAAEAECERAALG